MLNKIIFKQNKKANLPQHQFLVKYNSKPHHPSKLLSLNCISSQFILHKGYHVVVTLKNYCIWESYNEVMIVCYDMQTHEWTLSKYKEEYL